MDLSGMDLKEEAILGEAIGSHWYYLAKGRALRAMLGRVRVPEVLDIGAGSGAFSRQLLDAGICERAVCVDPGYNEVRFERYHGHEIEFTRSVGRVSQGLLLLMDVLEHVDDDVGLLRGYTERMPDDARVLITVPAFDVPLSGDDVSSRHRGAATRFAGLRTDGQCARDCRVMRSLKFLLVLLFPGDRRHAAARPASGRTPARSKARSACCGSARLRSTASSPWSTTLSARPYSRFNRLAGLWAFCLARRS